LRTTARLSCWWRSAPLRLRRASLGLAGRACAAWILRMRLPAAGACPRCSTASRGAVRGCASAAGAHLGTGVVLTRSLAPLPGAVAAPLRLRWATSSSTSWLATRGARTVRLGPAKGPPTGRARTLRPARCPHASPRSQARSCSSRSSRARRSGASPTSAPRLRARATPAATGAWRE
jgi:hypothetical protein